MRIIKDRQIVEEEPCTHVGLDEPIPEGDVTLPLSRWLEARESLGDHAGRIGVRLHGEDELTDLLAHLDTVELIALEFPRFADGRCYTHARLLRERHGFEGELRAVGDVLRDQLFYMHRCGINAFEIREDRDVEDALRAFEEFTFAYQPATDQEDLSFRASSSSTSSAA